MKKNSVVRVKYIGEDNPLSLRYGKIYEARVLQKGWFGVVDSVIRLKNVKVENNRIVCLGYVEDCEEPIRISVDMDGNGESVEMPRGYEWCKSYVKSAERYLIKRYKQGTLKSEMMMMWG